MPTMHPFGVTALLLTATLLSACGSRTPSHTQVAGAVNPTAAASSRPPQTADTHRDPSSGQYGSGSQAGSQSGLQSSGAPAVGTPQAARSSADVIEISKCYTNATATTGGQLLIKARSSHPAAHLLAYRPDGTLIGEVQNGGSNRYGGTVIAYQPHDPVTVTIRSSAGGTSTAVTTPFPAGN